ncbi:hypothetical protein [Pseudothauera rhizosphaerae]|uniref:Uncharacterized protein n=1 Tax=Pseudothauera rhizosphaerae TaxID=2565932 RepID=A0A4S4AP73_9RHOO|nr:hypothetical protein [Pseudothauera rhizosphaerae]THF60939.1 hypothetical protein E6O51_11970 [Pseudothauera rhizosphaerae]
MTAPVQPLPCLTWGYRPNTDPTLPGYIVDGDGGTVANVQPGGLALGVLLAMAPEILSDLCAVVLALVQQDEDYRREHGIDLGDITPKDALREAIGNAVATLAYAAEAGLPVELPGLAQLEDTL